MLDLPAGEGLGLVVPVVSREMRIAGVVGIDSVLVDAAVDDAVVGVVSRVF